MVNRSIFNTRGRGKHSVPAADAVNAAGGVAYALTDQQALAQIAATGCFNGTFYADADEQLAVSKELALKLPATFVAQLAIYARQRAFMKDMPAFLLVALAARREHALLRKTFPKVVTDARMLRNVVQLVRSNALGIRSFGKVLKRLIADWLNAASVRQLINASVGNDPALADIIRMIHPRPANTERAALYRWLIGKTAALPRSSDWKSAADMPRLVQDLVAFRAAPGEREVPDVEFRLLTSQPLPVEAWRKIARRMTWTQLRLNLNTLARNDVFGDKALVEELAAKLADEQEVFKARVFPYQIMTSHLMVDAQVPDLIRQALAAAMEHAVANVPALAGHIAVCIDVSGSMSAPVTGHRKGATTAVSCVDVAALIGAVMLRNCAHTRLLPFDTAVRHVNIRRDTPILDAARKLAIHGGGTACSAPLAELNRQQAKVDLVLLVSDHESWADSRLLHTLADTPAALHEQTIRRSLGTGTQFAYEWAMLKTRCPQAKLVCLDLTPNRTAQIKPAPDVLLVGGFSDAVFDVVGSFLADGSREADHWVKEIEKIDLDA